MYNFGKSAPFSKALKDFIKDWAISNIETFDVAIVVGVSNYNKRLVDVLPLCIQEDADGIAPAKPVITECPVVLQGNFDGFLHFPLRKGDKVLIGYPKDSIEEFTYSTVAQQYFPVDNMKFQGSQAVVLGYAHQAPTDKELSPEDFEIDYYDAKLSLTPSNAFKYSNPSATLEIDGQGNLSFTNGSISANLNSNGTFNITGGQGTINGATITSGGNVITAAGSDVDEIRADLNALNAAYSGHGDGLPDHPPSPAF